MLFTTTCAPYLTIVFVYIVTGLVSFQRSFRLRSKTTIPEPPRVSSSIPLIGHVFRYVTGGPSYLHHLWQQSREAIFTLMVFNQRVYVFADAEALQVAEKNHKTIINDELFVGGTSRLFLWSKRQADIALLHLNDPGAIQPSLLKAVRPALRDSLRPGAGLDHIGLKYQHDFGGRTNCLAMDGPQITDLWSWLRQNMTLSAGIATFGSQHPFVRDESLVSDFWAVEKDNLKLILYAFPSIMLRRAYKARKRVLKAMTEYVKGDGLCEVSVLVQAYHKVLGIYNLTEDEIGSFDATVLTAFIGSLIPLGFWLVCFFL